MSGLSGTKSIVRIGHSINSCQAKVCVCVCVCVCGCGLSVFQGVPYTKEPPTFNHPKPCQKLRSKLAGLGFTGV